MLEAQMRGSEEAVEKVKEARRALWKAQTELLASGGWGDGHKSTYDGCTTWFHKDVGTLISRPTAISLAMGEAEL